MRTAFAGGQLGNPSPLALRLNFRIRRHGPSYDEDARVRVDGIRTNVTILLWRLSRFGQELFLCGPLGRTEQCTIHFGKHSPRTSTEGVPRAQKKEKTSRRRAEDDKKGKEGLPVEAVGQSQSPLAETFLIPNRLFLVLYHHTHHQQLYCSALPVASS